MRRRPGHIGIGLSHGIAAVVPTIELTGGEDSTRTITITGATGGTWKINAQNVGSDLAWNATAVQVRNEIQGVLDAGIDLSGSAVTGNAGGPWNITFRGGDLNPAAPAGVTVDGTNLT